MPSLCLQRHGAGKMNEWLKLGSGETGVNVRVWVAAAAAANITLLSGRLILEWATPAS
jgi:hypothetical protein